MNTNHHIFTRISKRELFICKMNSCMRKGKMRDEYIQVVEWAMKVVDVCTEGC